MRKLNNKHYAILEEMNLPLLLMLEAEELHSDDEPHADQEADQQQEDPNAQANQEAMDQANQPQGPSEEDVFNAELTGTQDKFVQFILYDKLNELSNKLEIIKDNIQIRDTDFDNDFNERIEQYSQYINVLNELIFSVSTSTIYNIVGQLELELIELLEAYTKFHNQQKGENI